MDMKYKDRCGEVTYPVKLEEYEVSLEVENDLLKRERERASFRCTVHAPKGTSPFELIQLALGRYKEIVEESDSKQLQEPGE